MNGWLNFYIRCILSLQIVLSGLTPAFAEQAAPTPQASPSSQPAKALTAIPGVDLQGLFNDIAQGYERAIYPNDIITQRTMGGPLKSRELDELTDRLFAVRKALTMFIEAQYTSIEFKSETINGETINTTDQNAWLAAVYLYITMAEMIERTHLAMGEQLEPASWSKYDLTLDLNGFSLMEFLLTASLRVHAMEVSQPYPMMGTRIDRKQNHLVFSLNPERAIPIYTDSLANEGSAASVKKYLAWTAYYGLYQNLAKLNQLQTRSAKVLAEPSAAMQAQFPIARHLRALARRSDDRFIWENQFQIVGRQLPKILKKLEEQNLRFVNAEFVKGMLAAVGASQDDAQLAQSVAQLANDEDATSNIQTAAMLYLGTTHPPQTPEQWVQLMVDAIVDFKTLQQRFDRVATEQINEQQKDAVLELIELRAQQLKADPQVLGIVRSEITPLLPNLSPEQVLWNQRQELNTALIKKSQELRNIPDEIDMPSWIDARRGHFPSQPSATVTRWIGDLASAKSWDEAVAKYETTLFAYLSSFDLGQGYSWLAKASPVPFEILQKAAPGFRWDSDRIANVFSVPEKLRAPLAGQNQARQRDLLDWLTIGKALMFDRAKGMTIQKLMQEDCIKGSSDCKSTLTKSERSDYERAYQANAMMLYPILNSSLTPDNVFLNAGAQFAIRIWDYRKPLWQKLEPNESANAVITDHILELEKNILADFSYIEDSLPTVSLFNKVGQWIDRKAGISEKAEALDSIKPEFLVLIEKGSLLAANIKQRKVLAGSFTEMRESLERQSDFGKAVGFLDKRANTIINVAVAVALLQGLAAYFDKSKLLVGSTRLLMSWLEPSFGPGATYLQKFALYWMGGQMAYYGIQSLNQKNQLLVLAQFYNSIANIAKSESESPADALARATIMGQALATKDDMLKQKLVTFDYQFKFAMYTTALAGVAIIFKGIPLLKQGGAWSADRYLPMRETWTSRAEQDFRMLGFTPDKYTFNRTILDNKLEGTLSQVDSIVDKIASSQSSTARAMTERAAASAIEQSRARLEQAVLEETKRWQVLTDVYMPDIKALELNPSTWWDPQVYARRMMEIERTPHTSFEMAEIVRHRTNLERLLTLANNRAAADPVYKLVLEGAFQRRGADLEKAFDELNKVLDPRTHISNLIRTSKGRFSLVPGVPEELQKMVRVMNDQGVIGDKAIRDEKVLRDYIRAIHNKVQWKAAR